MLWLKSVLDRLHQVIPIIRSSKASANIQFLHFLRRLFRVLGGQVTAAQIIERENAAYLSQAAASCLEESLILRARSIALNNSDTSIGLVR